MGSQETIDFIRNERENPTDSEEENPPVQADSGILLPAEANEAASTQNKKKERIKFTGLARVIEQLMNKCCSPDLEQTEGLGGDNMTAIIV